MTDKFTKAQHLMLPVCDIKPHPNVQRKFRPEWARELRDTFDPDKFGEIAVVKENGHYLTFDGQHRLWAAHESLGANQRVPCIIYADMPVERQAELFLGRNTTRSVRAIDKFKMAVVARRQTESRVHEIATSMGLKIQDNYHPGVIRSPSALTKVFAHYGEPTLIRTLGVLRDAWGSEADAFDGTIIRGAAYFLHQFSSEITDAELVRKLSRASGPARVLGSARDHAKGMGMTVERATAERLLILYNNGRRNKLAWISGGSRPPARSTQGRKS